LRPSSTRSSRSTWRGPRRSTWRSGRTAAFSTRSRTTPLTPSTSCFRGLTLRPPLGVRPLSPRYGSDPELEVHPVSALQLQDRARLVRRGDLEAEPLDDLARGVHLLGVGLGELAGADPEGILEAYADVAAERNGLRGDRELIAAG